jgi:hypothetical protein
VKEVNKATKMMQSEFSNHIGPAGKRKIRKLQKKQSMGGSVYPPGVNPAIYHTKNPAEEKNMHPMVKNLQ